MILEDSNSKKLLSGPSRAPITALLLNIDISHNRVLLVKCAHLVYKMITCALNRDQFSLQFLKTIHAEENTPGKIEFTVAMPRIYYISLYVCLSVVDIFVFQCF